MSYNTLIEMIISEAMIKPKPVETFGINIEEYDDGKIMYSGLLKSFYTVFKVDEGYIRVSINRYSGMINYAFSDNAYIGRMPFLPALTKRNSLMKALKHLPEILFIIIEILKQYHMRIPQLQLISRFNLQDRYHNFLFKSPSFKVPIKKYRFKDIKRSIQKSDDEELILYTIRKDE